MSEAQALTPRCPVCGSDPDAYVAALRMDPPGEGLRPERAKMARCGTSTCPVFLWDPSVEAVEVAEQD